MDIINRLYPYPVLWKKNDDYVNSSFDCDMDISKNFEIITIKIKFKLKNKLIDELIEKGKAEYLVHIESPSTSYRFIKTSVQKELSFDLKDEHLLGTISLCSFIVVKEKMENYYNPQFNSDYEGVEFSLDVGNILAIGSQYKFNVEKNSEELADVPSIFTVYKREDDDSIDMKVEINSDKIRIGLSKDVYENYNHIVSLQMSMINTVNAIILFPTLIYIIEQLKNELEDYEDYRWFQALRRLLKKNSMNLEEIIDNEESIILAQKIMNMPISKALLSIKDMDMEAEDE